MTQRNGTGREEGSGWGTRVYLWRIHVDIWQNQYNIEKLKNKKIIIKHQKYFKKKKPLQMLPLTVLMKHEKQTLLPPVILYARLSINKSHYIN